MLSPRTIGLSLLLACAGMAYGQQETRSLFITGHYEDGVFESTTLANEISGAMIFYNSGFFGRRSVIANVEGGHIWAEHEVFDRSGIDPGLGVPAAVTQFVSDPSVTAQTDYHATMVGHILAGTGFIETETGGSFTYAGIGMAPYAEMWSGAVATSFSDTEIGNFSTTTESILTPYRTFFRGIEGRKADVINSSWGGGDVAAATDVSQTLDGLALENATVALVTAAGNSGDSAPGLPASGYNNISVGSLGGADFLTPSEFTSRRAGDFYNPETGVTIFQARAVVDIAAPGEELFLAAYLGPTGSLATVEDVVQDPSPTDLYFLNMDGTSFSAPTVAGGIALLKDVVHSYEGTPIEMPAATLDTRVVKSVLMAGAKRTNGWDNQQSDENGVITTTQALDLATGAGALDLETTANIYLLGETEDIAGTGGGMIGQLGWDFGALEEGTANEYRFSNAFAGETELTVSLNWFAGTVLDDETDLGAGLSFANLNLEVWLVDANILTTKVAESISIYNNTEFLRLGLTMPGTYALRVTFLGMVYDLDPSTNTTEYGLAWQAKAVPEPGITALVALAAGLLFVFRRRSA